MTGCMNEKKALRYYDSHLEKLAKVCSAQYPAVNYEKDSTAYQKGHTQLLAADTLNVNISKALDSFINTLHDSTQAQQLQDSVASHPVYIRIPCPPATRRVDTVTRYRYTQVSNTAKETYLQYQRDSVSAELVKSKTLCQSWQDTAKGRSKTVWKLSIALGLLIAGGIIAAYLKLRLKFPV